MTYCIEIKDAAQAFCPVSRGTFLLTQMPCARHDSKTKKKKNDFSNTLGDQSIAISPPGNLFNKI